MLPFFLQMFKDFEIQKESIIYSIGKAVGSRLLVYASSRTAFLDNSLAKASACVLGGVGWGGHAF